MKYSMPHEAVGQVTRKTPPQTFDPCIPVFARIKGVEKKVRLLSVAAYFGLAPLLWMSGVDRQQNGVLKHHTRHGLGFAFTIFCGVVFYILQMTVTYTIFAHVWRPTMEEFDAAIPIYGIYVMLDSLASSGIILAWLVMFFVSVFGAVRGRVPRIPVLTWLTSKSGALRVGAYWSLFMEFLLVIFLGVGAHSIQLAGREQSDDAKVYVLYTIGGYIPLPELYETFTPSRWMVTMAFYPTVRAGMEKFGMDGVALLPLTEENFRHATRTGKFIFVASHGGSTSGSFTLSMRPHIQYTPSAVDVNSVGENLQFVYFAGCYTGDLETEWKQALQAEQAILFDRISYVDEHMLWVWFKSPGVIKNLQ